MIVLRSLLLVAIALTSQTVSAGAQSLIGKTIQTSGTMQVCDGLTGRCADPINFNYHIYIGTDGHYFEFTGPNSGRLETLGVPSTAANGYETLITVSGNVLRYKARSPNSQSGTTFTITAKGYTCSVSSNSGDRTIPHKTRARACTVTEGRVEHR